jgi:uncharacterized protein
VKWTRGTRNDHVIDRRGAAAPKVAGAGIGVVIVIYVIARLTGVDVSGLLGGGGGGGGTSGGVDPAQKGSAAPTGPDSDKELVDYIHFVWTSIDEAFTAELKKQGKTYERPYLEIFSEATDTKCGLSSSAIGPFYCPPNKSAYIDLTFYRDLRARFGAPGDFAQAYVLAHEVGHHLQNLFGVDQDREKLAASRTRNEHSVRVELQADCYAGVWGKYAANQGRLEQGDLEEALTAATAIGDDRLQKQSGREVNPETFTHGTSQQRVKWFRKGFEAGTLAGCDTFSVPEP